MAMADYIVAIFRSDVSPVLAQPLNLKTAVEMVGQAACLVQHGLQRFDVKDGAVGAELLKPLPFKAFSLPAVVN